MPQKSLNTIATQSKASKINKAGPNSTAWHSPFVMVAIVLNPFSFHAFDKNVIYFEPII